MTSSRAAGGLAIVLCSALLLCACGSSSPASSDGGKAFTIGATEPSAGLDLATPVTQYSLRVMELIYDPLLDYGSGNKLNPMIAEPWTVLSGGVDQRASRVCWSRSHRCTLAALPP